MGRSLDPTRLLTLPAFRRARRHTARQTERDAGLAVSDRAVARRLRSLMKKAWVDPNPDGPDCRERYLAWLRRGPDARFHPFNPLGPEAT